MNKSLEEVAKLLKSNCDKLILAQLVYAFNGTGKTRLSMEFKNLIESESGEEKINKMLYFNAFTEDLFQWDNSFNEDGPKLKITPNSFTNWILRDQGKDIAVINIFQRYVNNKLNPIFNEIYDQVQFTLKTGDSEKHHPLKISKGEESCFIWSVFYAILEQIVNLQTDDEPLAYIEKIEYVFIDDPVSSLDENHLIEIAMNLAELIKKSAKNNRGLKFIITTHNPFFYNVLHSELNNKTCYFLEKEESGYFTMTNKKGGSNVLYSYHRHLLEIIKKAIDENALERYHFTLLRNLYEKAANFLGYEDWTSLLPFNKELYTKHLNFYSHDTLSTPRLTGLKPEEKKMVEMLLNHLIKKVGFQILVQ